MFSDLSDDELHTIVQFLDHSSNLSLSSTNKKMNQITSHNLFWSEKIQTPTFTQPLKYFFDNFGEIIGDPPSFNDPIADMQVDRVHKHEFLKYISSGKKEKSIQQKFQHFWNYGSIGKVIMSFIASIVFIMFIFLLITLIPMLMDRTVNQQFWMKILMIGGLATMSICIIFSIVDLFLTHGFPYPLRIIFGYRFGFGTPLSDLTSFTYISWLPISILMIILRISVFQYGLWTIIMIISLFLMLIDLCIHVGRIIYLWRFQQYFSSFDFIEDDNSFHFFPHREISGMYFFHYACFMIIYSYILILTCLKLDDFISISWIVIITPPFLFLLIILCGSFCCFVSLSLSSIVKILAIEQASFQKFFPGILFLCLTSGMTLCILFFIFQFYIALFMKIVRSSELTFTQIWTPIYFLGILIFVILLIFLILCLIWFLWRKFKKFSSQDAHHLILDE
jgi:hypothetical protein